jgi:hypothetical protein
MDLDPTSGRPGAAGPSRAQTALATEARRGVTPPEVERDAVSRTSERATYTSPGLRPAGDATRDVVVHLSQKALALAKSASNPPPRTKSVDRQEDDEAKKESPLHHDGRPARWTKRLFPPLSLRA